VLDPSGRHHPLRRRVRGGISPHFPFHRVLVGPAPM